MSDVETLLASASFAVAGASRNPAKFGYRVLKHYASHGRDVIGINPKEQEIDGIPCYPDLAAAPEPPEALSLVTPPAVTDVVVDQALELGIRKFWMQPGAESADAIQRAEAAGALVLHGGVCVLIELR